MSPFLRKTVVPLLDSTDSRPESLEFIQRCQTTLGAFLAHDLVTEFSAVWTCLESFPRNRSERETAMAAGAVCALAHGLFERVPVRCDQLRQPSTRSTVAFALSRIRLDFRKGDLSLVDMARELNLSYTYVSRSFSCHTGHGFSAHVNGLRLLAAAGLLLQRELPIGGVATAVGYVSTRELDRQFQKRFGLSPKRFGCLLGLLPDSVRRRQCGRAS